ncbi:MAG TPA: ABC transporter permease [Gaiellaceae bacterium]|jgi:simple sugar transport system permease protein|nr:ABC transporter permease [Gaiellaceae bacterium]
MATRAEVRPLWRGIGAREVATLGILLGCLAFLLALPPITARAPWWPALAGVPAIAAGIWAVSRGAGRVGWFSVAAGVLGIALGVLATHSSAGHLDSAVSWTPLFTAMFAFATPLTFAALGGMFSERSGVVNIGLEGMMLSGAFFAVLGADKLGNWSLGLLCAIVAGGVAAAIHAFVSIHLRADQIVSGTAINFLALGVTGYFFIQIYGENGTPGSISQVPDVNIPGLESIGFIGPVFGHLNLMVWLMFLALVLSYIVIFRTPLGLRIRSVGEHPRAADTVGISVYRIRYGSVILSGMLSALGGAYLSIGFVGSFNENMTAGRGFIGLAALIFGNWRPFGAFAAALLFGFSTALSFRLAQPWGNSAVLFQALPYVLTLIAVAGLIGRSIPPAASGRPYVKQ